MHSCLIVGQHSAFTNFLIDKFTKEDWRVCTLSESGSAPQKVFQHYTYSYSSEDLSRAFESCHPNVVIYMGAYDNAYRGAYHKSDLKQRYIGNVSNLLMCSSKSGVRHFVYLSSEQVYDKSSVVDITEDMVPHPITEHGIILRQGEMLALEYNSTATMESTVVRLCNLYYMPNEAVDCIDVVTSKCLSAAKGDEIAIDSKYSYSVLNSGDAVEALYKLVSSEERSHSLYHIASKYVLDDNELVKVIQTAFVRKLSINDVTLGVSSRRVLNGELFSNEFSFSTKVDYQQAIAEIVRVIQSSLSKFLHSGNSSSVNEKKHTFLKTLFSVAEVFLTVLICFFLTSLFKHNDALSSIDIYLLCTLLFSAYYGSKMGVLSASLCTLVRILTETNNRTGLAVLMDMKVYIWIAQIFIVALAVGYVRDTLMQTKRDIKLETDYLNDRLDNINNINQSNVRIKDFFEERVVDSSESVGYIYNIIEALDNAKQNEVLFEATRILIQMLETESISIYQVLENGYLRVISSTNERSRSLGKSIRKDSLPVIFDQLETKKSYVNRSLDSALPGMIGCLADVNDNISFIVMLWDVKYDHMTLYYLNLLQVICKLISNAVARSVELLEITKNSRLIENTNILNEKAFEELLELYKKASDNHLTEYCLINVATHGRSPIQMNDLVKDAIRFTDSMGMCGTDTLQILLTNTNVFDSRIVIKRLKDKGLDASAAI